MNATNALGAILSQTQMAIAQEVMKTAAQSQAMMAQMLAQNVENVPVSTTRGGTVDLSL